jgi:hypothetical protein
MAFAGGRPVPRGLLRSLCRRRRRTHPPARPFSRAQCPVGYPDLPPQASVLVCVGAAAAGALGGAWYGFAVASRRTSSGHAVHVCLCHPGAVATVLRARLLKTAEAISLQLGIIYLRAASSGLADTQLCFNPLGVAPVYWPGPRLAHQPLRIRSGVAALGNPRQSRHGMHMSTS